MRTDANSTSTHRSARLAALAFVAVLVGPLPTHAANFIVDDGGEASDATPGDGVCATAGAVCTLRAAIEEANALAGNDAIAIGVGTLVTTTQLPDITTNVSITGVGSALTIIQAGAGHPQLFNVTSTGNLILSQLQLTNAHRAVGSTDGPVTITDCLITGNTTFPAIDVGGNGGATVTYTIVNSTISNNAANAAPALQVQFGNLVATNVNFLNNTATGGGAGGAVLLHGGAAFTHHFQNCIFSGNSAGTGGAIITDGGPLTIDDSTFTNNTATSGGGAIQSNATLVTITDTTFAANHAAGAGIASGGALMLLGQARARRVTFSGNDATGQGGALFVGGNVGAQLDCIDCTFSGNSATDGGGAVATGNGSGVVTLASSTVTANSATNASSGGALFAGQANGIRIKNTIVAGNTNTGAPDCGGAQVQTAGYNLIGNNTGCALSAGGTGDQVGTGASPINPGLGPLADNGGATMTHALLSNSPAGDAANPLDCSDFSSGTIVTDQRGNLRQIDGNNDGDARCDIGAFEADAGTFPTPSTTTTLPGATTTSVTNTTTTTSTSTTLAPVCIGGTTISKAMLTVKKLGDPPGNEALAMKGTLDFPAGFPAGVDPSTKGAQLLIEDLGSGNAAVFDLTYRSTAIPPGAPGTGCNPKDGWKKLAYKNVSGALDPPTCTARSADGLVALRFKDKRTRSKGIAFTAKAKNAQLPVLVGPARITVVLGGTVTESEAGECGVIAFEAGSCKHKKTTLTCK